MHTMAQINAINLSLLPTRVPDPDQIDQIRIRPMEIKTDPDPKKLGFGSPAAKKRIRTKARRPSLVEGITLIRIRALGLGPDPGIGTWSGSETLCLVYRAANSFVILLI